MHILYGGAVSAALKAQLRSWFENEWGHIDSFSGNHEEIAVPAPLVAVSEHNRLLGGLAFSSHPKPSDATIAVWINALLVAPEHRGQGIATALLAGAVTTAQQLGVPELFVLTEYPELYQKSGWATVGVNGEGADVILQRVP